MKLYPEKLSHEKALIGLEARATECVIEVVNVEYHPGIGSVKVRPESAARGKLHVHPAIKFLVNQYRGTAVEKLCIKDREGGRSIYTTGTGNRILQTQTVIPPADYGETVGEVITKTGVVFGDKWKLVAKRSQGRIRGGDLLEGESMRLTTARIKELYGEEKDTSSFRSIADSPFSRAQRLLRWLTADAEKGKPLTARGHALAQLASVSHEAREVIWGSLETGSPKLRWLSMELLAAHDFSRLAPHLVGTVQAADAEREREALLGALVTARQGRIPDELRTPLTDALRGRLIASDRQALAGLEPLRTELVAQTLDTFRSFAGPAELPLLRGFWGSECTFTVQLRALQAARFVTGRFPEAQETNAFYDKESRALSERFSTLARERMVAVQNGSLLWTVAETLLSRLGPESLDVVAAAEEHPALHAKLRRIVNDTEAHLCKLGQHVWLKAQAETLRVLHIAFPQRKRGVLAER